MCSWFWWSKTPHSAEINGSWLGRTLCLWSYNMSWSLNLVKKFMISSFDYEWSKVQDDRCPRFWIWKLWLSQSDWLIRAWSPFIYCFSYLFMSVCFYITTRPFSQWVRGRIPQWPQGQGFEPSVYTLTTFFHFCFILVYLFFILIFLLIYFLTLLFLLFWKNFKHEPLLISASRI